MSASSDNQSITRLQTAAALAVGTVALLILGVQPILLGDLVSRGEVTLQGVGWVATSEPVGIGLGVILGNLLLPVTRARAVALYATLFVAMVDLATGRAHGDIAFTVVRALAGIGEGVLVWVTTGLIVRSPAPDRLASIFFVVQTLAQVGIAALMAVFIMSLGGWVAGFGALALMHILSLAFIPSLKRGFEPLRAETGPTPPALTVVGVLALLTAFAQMASIGAVWAYLDPLGRVAGLHPQSVQILVAAVVAAQLAGGSLVSLISQRIPTLTLLSLALLLQGLFAALLSTTQGSGAAAFAALSIAIGFLWLFCMPLHVRLALNADPVGRVATLVPAMQLLGVAFGPTLTSFYVVNDDVRAVPWMSAALAAAGLGLLIVRRGHFRSLERSTLPAARSG